MDRSTTSAGSRWQDWASFALGLWLALSPWAADYAERQTATANAVFVGLALALCAHFEASFDELSAEWLNLAAGVWLVAAPFMLGFGAADVATANCIVVGACVAVLAISALSLDKEINKWWHKRSQPIDP